MAKQSPVPRFVRVANLLTTTLLRLGVKLFGPGHAPLYLLTVRGRTSGQPRTTPVAIVAQEEARYLLAPYGVVDWVRNLRAAGEGTLTRGRRAEAIRASELPRDEAGRVLERFIASGNPIGRAFGVSKDAAPEAFVRAAASHPVFLVRPAHDPAQHAA
jgi:deazaflavin-dependent oxidoreductase (nitroreductase family)